MTASCKAIAMEMRERMTKPTKRLMRSVKTLINLSIRAVWSESSLITYAFYSLRAIQRGINENPCPGEPWMDVQADLSLCWLHRSYYKVWRALAQKYIFVHEPQSQKTYLRKRAPRKDSDQPANSHRLIRIFIGNILDSQGFQSFFTRRTKTLIRLRGYTGWFESLLDAHIRGDVFSHDDSYYIVFVVQRGAGPLCSLVSHSKLKSTHLFYQNSFLSK